MLLEPGTKSATSPPGKQPQTAITEEKPKEPKKKKRTRNANNNGVVIF